MPASTPPPEQPADEATMRHLAREVDNSVRPAIDRALERDHSLCGAEPCSDCR